MATQQAAHAAALHRPSDLEQRGDELLQRYQSDSFQRAVGNGRYNEEHKALLNDMFDFIQSADLRSEQLGMLPAEAELVSDWGWWSWVRPPVRNSRAQQEPEAAAAAAAAAVELSPIPGTAVAATSMAAAVGAESDSRSLATQRGRTPRNSDGIRRSFAGYTAATPIALGRGRFTLSLPMRLKGLVSEASGLADCVLRQWVCAVNEQQYAADLLHHWGDGVASVRGVSQAPFFSSDHDAGIDDVLWSGDDLDRLPGLPAGSSLAAFEEGPPPLHLSGTAAENSMPGTTPGVTGSGTPAPAAAAAADVVISGSPFNPTHDRVEVITFKKKSNPSGGGVAAANSSQGPAQARASMQLLVDTSVGWCLLEPGREVKASRQAKRCRTGSSSELGEVGLEPLVGYQADAAAAAAAASVPAAGAAAASTRGVPAAAAAAPSGVLVFGLAAPSGAAAAAPKSAGSSIQSAAPSRATAASEHLISDAVTSLSQRIQRLQLPVLDPVDVVALFHPKADVDKASAILSDAVQLAQLKQVLLTKDVRDEFDRNVLHLAVSRRAANQLGAPLQQQLLDLLLLDDPELRQLSLTRLQLQGNNHASTPLIVAAAAAGEQPEIFRKLLAVVNADVLEARTKQGWTVLHTLASAAGAGGGGGAAAAATAGEVAGSPEQQHVHSSYWDCIAATIRRLIEVARAAAACEPQLTAAEQQQLVSEWVLGVVGRAEPFSRHYKGQRIMAAAKELAQQELRSG